MDAVDRLFRESMGVDRPFGNKLFLIGGDFRQTLPIVKRGKRVQIVQSSVKSSRVWRFFQPMKLHQNMRTGPDEIEYNEWLMELGEGKLSNEYNLGEDIIEVPRECIEENDLIASICGERIALDNASVKILANKAILTPRN